jgi:hypothetical protein
MIVYTAMIGSARDNLRPIIARPDGRGRKVEYVCFSDIATLTVPPGWEIRAPLWRHDHPRRTARWHKTMAHAALGADVQHSLWIDATQQLLVNPWELVDRYLVDGRDIAVFRHPQRSCVYQELTECIRLRYDDEATMRKQVDRYEEEGYPAGQGLFEMSAVLRAHTPRIREFNEACWREIHTGSLRDQLCVNYVAWKMKLPVAFMAGHRVASPYFKFYPHERAT